VLKNKTMLIHNLFTYTYNTASKQLCSATRVYFIYAAKVPIAVWNSDDSWQWYF